MLNNKIRIYSQKKKRKYIKKKKIITVVTIVYNDEKNIEKTIKSVVNQKYKNIEYIIVITPSKDKTFEIIKKYKSKIHKIIVCKKKGIFLAMNVGSKFAKGEYINFMNSGDYFVNKNTVNDIFKNEVKSDVIYGDCILYYNQFLRKIIANPLRTIIKELPFAHQSSFVKTKLQKKYNFNLRYNQSADYEFFLRLFKKNKKFSYYKKYISKRLPYGNSDKKLLTLYDNYIISIKHLGERSLLRKIKFFEKIFYYGINQFFQIILPVKVIYFLVSIKVKMK